MDQICLWSWSKKGLNKLAMLTTKGTNMDAIWRGLNMVACHFTASGFLGKFHSTHLLWNDRVPLNMPAISNPKLCICLHTWKICCRVICPKIIATWLQEDFRYWKHIKFVSSFNLQAYFVPFLPRFQAYLVHVIKIIPTICGPSSYSCQITWTIS